MPKFTPNPNITRGPTQSSGSTHQMTGSVTITGSLTVNGVAITGGGGGGGGGIAMEGSTANGVLTRKNSTTASVESALVFDGSTLTVTGDTTSTGNTILGNAASDYHQVSGTLAITGSLIQGGGSGLDPNVYEGRDQVSLGYAGEDASGNDEGSQ